MVFPERESAMTFCPEVTTAMVYIPSSVNVHTGHNPAIFFKLCVLKPRGNDISFARSITISLVTVTEAKAFPARPRSTVLL